MCLQSAVRRVVVKPVLSVSAAPMQYALRVPKIKIFYTKFGVLDFNPPVDTGNFPDFTGGLRHVGLVDLEQNSY